MIFKNHLEPLQYIPPWTLHWVHPELSWSEDKKPPSSLRSKQSRTVSHPTKPSLNENIRESQTAPLNEIKKPFFFSVLNKIASGNDAGSSTCGSVTSSRVGWGGMGWEVGGVAQEGQGHTHAYGWLCWCMAESNTAWQSNYPPIKHKVSFLKPFSMSCCI